MHRETLPSSQLAAWTRFNNVESNGVMITTVQGNRGLGLVATAESNDPLLMTVPSELVLSLENVWIYAKSDRYLRQILEATGNYSRVSGPKASMKDSEALDMD